MSELLEPYDLSAAHLFAPDGILVMSGPGIRPGSRLDKASIYDPEQIEIGDLQFLDWGQRLIF